MEMLSWLRGHGRPVARRPRRVARSFETLDERRLLSIGIGFVGLSKAPATEMSTLASQIKSNSSEVEVSFLPFEFNPSNPFGNATKLAKEALPGFSGKLRMTVDLEWFVHSNGDANGKLDDGSLASEYGRPAQKAFWQAWENYNPNASRQPKIITDFLGRVRQSDAWVKDIRAWAASQGINNKFNVTFVPVLEDESPNSKAYANLVNAIKKQQSADGISSTDFRRSKNGDYSANFRVAGVSMELHGLWSSVRNSLQRGDTWSNDGTSYGIENFVADGRSAKAAGISVLYWNSDMNGTPKKDTNWASRTVNVFSGTPASANKARLSMVLTL